MSIKNRIQSFNEKKYDKEILRVIQNYLIVNNQDFIELLWVFLMAAELEISEPGIYSFPSYNIQLRIDSLVNFNQYSSN